MCFQGESPVSTYINIILYDIKYYKCYIISITNTRHQKVKSSCKKEIHIYRYNDSGIDNEEVAI